MKKIYVGSKVKCIDDHFVDLETNPFKKNEIDLPKKEVKYTVRDIYTNKYGTGVRLNEITNSTYHFGTEKELPNNGLVEPLFGIHRFIPIEEDSN